MNKQYFKIKKFTLIFFLSLFLIFPLQYLLAQSGQDSQLFDLIREANKNLALTSLAKISILVAFLAGVVSFLSPCILPILPVYFAYTFKEKKEITKATLIFSAGFSLVFVSMGLLAGVLGLTSLNVFPKRETLALIGGIFLVGFGLLTFFNVKIKFLESSKVKQGGKKGIFFSGMALSLGWTACLGPVLAGILSIGLVLHNYFISALLMLSYSLGIFFPLFILSFFFDKVNLDKFKLLKGFPIRFKIGTKEFFSHSSSIVAGLLLTLMGLILIIFRNTAIFNNYDIFKTRQLFYDAQDFILELNIAWAIGAVLTLIFASLIYLSFRKRK